MFASSTRRVTGMHTHYEPYSGAVLLFLARPNVSGGCQAGQSSQMISKRLQL